MSQAEKLSVSLTPKMRADLAAAVASGEFASTSEALRDAMRVWTREREERAQTLESIRERVRHSLADPRPSLSGDEVFGHLDRTRAQRLRRSDGDEAA